LYGYRELHRWAAGIRYPTGITHFLPPSQLFSPFLI
jgi:hypothetical protein